MLLINETAPEYNFIIREDKESGKKNFFIEGIFLQGNLKNKNGRIYPIDILESEVNRYVKEEVNNNRAFGELGHPAGPQINLDRVSHRIVELKKDGDNFIGKAQVSSTPMGMIVQNLIQDGAQLGVSSRGMGSLKVVKGIQEVQQDFRLATAADVVASPSAPQAYIKGIMEGVEWWFDLASETWRSAELVENQIKSIHKMTKEQISSSEVKLFADFVKTLG